MLACFSCRAGLRANRQTENTQRGVERSSTTPTGRGRETGQRKKAKDRIERRVENKDGVSFYDRKGADLLSEPKQPSHPQLLQLLSPCLFTNMAGLR